MKGIWILLIISIFLLAMMRLYFIVSEGKNCLNFEK